jgi:hypothetical protein
VVLRTIATVSWLVDILDELVGDVRVQVLFTIDDDASAFDDGVRAAVQAIGGRFIPWSQAIATPFDLAVAASHNGSLQRLRSPLLLTPHGIGFNKTQTVPDDGIPPLPASQKTPRATVTLSHHEQLHLWATGSGHDFQTAVVGDPWFDRLTASLPRRDRYRRALRVASPKRLVVISSTWRRHSLLACQPQLPAALLAQLPADEYRIAAIIHPNVWSAHGAWQVRAWLRDAREAGLEVMAPIDGWRSALVAADCLIGDHGSVTFYAAALGVPVLLGAWGDDEVAPGSPMDAFGRAAPRLAVDEPLRPRVADVAGQLDPDRYRDLVARSFAYPGEALARLRDLIYRLLSLQPPRRAPRALPVAAAVADAPELTAHLVVAVGDSSCTAAGELRVALERYPAILETPHRQRARYRHLVVDDVEPDFRQHESAAVIVRSDLSHKPQANDERQRVTWLREALRRHPGSRVAAAADECDTLVAVRGGPLLRASGDTRGVSPTETAALAASAIYIVSLVGWPERQPPWRLRVTVGTLDVALDLQADAREPR